MSITIEYPWPPKELSPNGRLHWAAKAKAVKQYRADCYMLTMASKAKIDWDGQVHLFIDFYPPDKRKYDDDGIASRFKAGRDGIATALGVDDFRFRQHPYLRGPGDCVRGGKVVVRITKGEF